MSRDPGLPALPQEICDNIIDSAWKDTSTLRTCSLVSRAWLHTSRKHKFSRIKVRPYMNLAALEAVITSPLLESTDIPHLVRDLCIDWTPSEGSSSLGGRFEPATLNARLPDMLTQFTSVDILRLECLPWSHFDGVARAEAAVIELAGKVAHLHLSDLSFTYGDDLVHLLSSSPRRSSLHMQECLFQGRMLRTSVKIPVHREAHVGHLVTDLESFAEFNLVMREAYVSRWAFGMTINKLVINGDGNALTDLAEFNFMEDYIADRYGHLVILKHRAHSRGLDDGDLPTTTLDIKSLRIPASIILRRHTFGFMYLHFLLYWRMLLARRVHFILDGFDLENAIPANCTTLDRAFGRLVANRAQTDVVKFDAHCPAERLADWIAAISACFPALVAGGKHVGMVCTSGEDPDGERLPVAQHWWS
ncbi:hypothetical protein EVJ58_g5255 [Rhodofomes roseus]|uniref:F-box domain-containing protein n=1 Tax=Rhodofomes roseus TaxID=34475 RepID=A0A4Y9YH62_9APHY|nr:hypothetical protein EVJ58_g5255 [Rhodofomes roseus]